MGHALITTDAAIIARPVEYVEKLDAKGERKTIKPNADEFIVGPDKFDQFGIR